MATGGNKETGSELLKIRTLTVKPDDLNPCGIVVVGDKLVITDGNSDKVHVYRRHDGMLLSSSHRLELWPYGVCCVNDTELCVVMDDGITLMSVSDSGLISRGRTFHLRKSFDSCTGVAVFKDNVVVSGATDNTTYWCVVSLQDGRHNNLHKVCGGRWSCMTTKENMAYISCFARDSPDNGVYGFNLVNPGQPPYTYKRLLNPRGITVDDNGYLFVCDINSIHHLTERCELVSIFKEGIPTHPHGIFWDRGILYFTAWESNVISMYETPHQVLPWEILKMDEKSKQLFKEALKKGEEKVYNIRVMVVGHGGVGKTTLIKRLLGRSVNIQERCATEGIDIDMHCCDVSIKTFEWKMRQTEDHSVWHRLKRFFDRGKFQKMHAKKYSQESEDLKEDSLILRVAKVVKEETLKTKLSHQPEQENHPSKKHPDAKQHDGGIWSNVASRVTIIQQQNKPSESKQEDPSTVGGEKQSKPAENTSNISETRGNLDSDFKENPLHSILCEKASKLPQSTDEHASLAVWDFAGQCAFYTTHQTFITRRAIYLLVSDVSQNFDNLVNDECYPDSRGKIKCHVRDLVEVWMNSIHSCASSPEEGIPPVILVGTHVDRIRKHDRHKVCDRYFKEDRTYLMDKPSRYHLVNEEFAIDNTVVDSKLENLKRKIVKVASQQKYWGEKIPAQWLPLEQALMKLRRDGRKVIPRCELEDLAATQEIATDQLNLFLRFQHDIGTILYFSIDILKEKIVLDPTWMIDALKSLINANDMAVMRNNPKVSDKVPMFKDYGILYPELIDAIWNKEQCPEFHDNKEHILLLMEQLNIIARPRSYVASEIKEENYFIAPCMLYEKTPQELICPKPDPQMENSSVLCYVFVEKFLPTPIFHRLLASCIARWPIATRKKENLIFCGCCVFKLGQNHKLTIHFREYVIFVRVARKGIKDKIISPKLCIEVRERITTMLNNIIGYLGQNLKFEYCILCPECNGDSVNGLIPISQLKENAEVECDFHDMIESHKLLCCWFEEVVKDPAGESQDDADAPITQEQINHARLCNALTTVCPNALRNILLTNVPAPHSDIYQAILYSKPNLKRLNKDQYQLVFPDPQGTSTGKVEEFDISLLYTIIRNVSSVPAPSNGWANPPADNPRDTTLGASVERIRLYRNKISGHSVDGEIGQQDFEHYWAMIHAVLHDIEIVIGNHGYLEDLEKRKNQAITPHEARELQKVFHEYKTQTEAAATGIMSALETALSEAKKLQGNKS